MQQDMGREFQNPGFSSRFLLDYEPVKRLGQGGFGIVLEARDKIVDINYAVKRIPLSSCDTEKEKVMREVKSHALLDHQHIVRYYKTWFEDPPPEWQEKTDVWLAKKVGSSINNPGWTPPINSSEFNFSIEKSSSGVEAGTVSQHTPRNSEPPKEFLYITMELCSGGTLQDWLQSNKRAPSASNKLFRQTCSGVAYIHKQKLIHRDLKPSNIYLSANGHIKIGDFGLATHPQYYQRYLHVTEKKAGLTQLVGTRLYMSPEQLKMEEYSHKVDIYSLGLILVDLLVPCSTDSERCKVLADAKEGNYPKNFQDWHACLSKMLHLNPDCRPEAAHVLAEEPKTPVIVRSR